MVDESAKRRAERFLCDSVDKRNVIDDSKQLRIEAFLATNFVNAKGNQILLSTRVSSLIQHELLQGLKALINMSLGRKLESKGLCE